MVVACSPLEPVTVTVTVVVASFDLVDDFVFVFVWLCFAFVELSLKVCGGSTVTVLELVVVWHPGTLTFVQRPLCGGPPGAVEVADAVPLSLPVSVPVSVDPVLSPAVVVVDDGWHDLVPMRWQRERPMPVAVVVSEGMSAAVSAGAGVLAGALPPAATTLTGTAATTAMGTQSRILARSRADRSCRCTALPSQGRPGPPAPPGPGSVHMFAPRCGGLLGGRCLWQGGVMWTSPAGRNGGAGERILLPDRVCTRPR